MARGSAPVGPDIRERVRAYVASATQLRQTAVSIASKVRAHNVGSVVEALEELVTEGQLRKEARPDREPIYSKGLGSWYAAARAADQPPGPDRNPPRPPQGPPRPGRGRPPR